MDKYICAVSSVVSFWQGQTKFTMVLKMSNGGLREETTFCGLITSLLHTLQHPTVEQWNNKRISAELCHMKVTSTHVTRRLHYHVCEIKTSWGPVQDENMAPY